MKYENLVEKAIQVQYFQINSSDILKQWNTFNLILR